MFRYVIFLSLCFYVSFGQSKGLKCGWYGKKTIEERRNTFPFNKAKKIYLVAFPSERSPIVLEHEDGTYEYVKYDSISYSKFKRKIIEVVELPQRDQTYLLYEKKKLEQSQVDILSNLLLNYKINKKKLPKELLITQANCYEPRNAILFVDEKEEIISYVEICFQCLQYYQGPEETIENFNTLVHLEECFGRVELLKIFFRNNQIEYGVIVER